MQADLSLTSMNQGLDTHDGLPGLDRSGSTGMRRRRPDARKPPPHGHGIRTLAVFHHPEVTGPAKSLRPRFEALAGDDRSLEVIVPGEGSLRRAYEDLGEVRVLAYEPLTVPRGPRAALRALGRLWREVQSFRAEMRHARPDLVVVVTAVLPTALIAARLERLATIVYVGEIFAKGHVGGRLRALGGRAVAALSAALADRLVCCSKTVADQFARRDNAVTIYPGISDSYARGDGAAFRARHGLGRASPLIAVIGNVCEARAQDISVRALAAIRERLPDAQLLIAGRAHPRPADEAFEAGVRELVRELGLERSVEFSGFVERVADAYSAADVVVNPARFNEPFGRVALEALIAGRPVVATAVGAIPEVLRAGRDALLVPRDDSQALADAVVRLLEDPSLSERLVAEGGRRVRAEFGEQRGVEAFEQAVAGVLAERAAPARRARA